MTKTDTTAGLAAAAHTTAIQAALTAKRAARTYLKALDLDMATRGNKSNIRAHERALAKKAADAATDLHDLISNL